MQSFSGTQGPVASAGQNLLRIAGNTAKLEEEDIALLRTITIDKETGYAMKLVNGKLEHLTDEEKEKLSFIIIDICLMIFAKHAKVASKSILDDYKKKIRSNLGTPDQALLPLLKVANTIANKITQGNIQPKTINKYIDALAGLNGYRQERFNIPQH